jgi:photosystem II stability/assembly factor-like uncharacterized protein
MRYVIVLLSFTLGFCLIHGFSLQRKTEPTGPGVAAGNTMNGEGRSAVDEREDFPFANHLDPKKYQEIYNAIQQMPPAPKSGLLKGHNRSVNTSLTQWESFGPSGVPDKSNPAGNQVFGRIRTMLWYYNFTSGGWEKYVGAGTGGFYFGQPVFTSVLWQSLGDNLPNPSVGAIAIDPTNPNVIFIGTGDWGRDYGSGVYKTTDRGQTWTSASWYSFPFWVTKIAYLVGNTTMIAASTAGVGRSTNGGANWYLSTVEPTDSLAACFNLVVVNPARLYASLPRHGVYTSPDGGTSWSKVSNGLPTRNGTTIAIDVSQSNPDILYAAYTDTNNNQGGIYKSTNAGGLWTRTNNPPSYISNGQGAHVNVIRVHPNNPNIVYAGSVGFVKSTDGGNTWTTPEAGHSDHTAIEFDPDDPNNMYLCSDGGILLRNDAMNTISNANYQFLPGAPLQVYEMDYAWSKSEEMIGGTQDNGELLTVGGSHAGDQWLEIGGCDGGNQISIDPTDPTVIYGNDWCGSDSPRWRSLTQGATAENIDNGLPNGTYIPIRLAKGGPKILFTCSTTGLYNSYNGGDNWLASTTNAGNDFPGPYPWLPRLSVNNYATYGNKVCYLTWGGNSYVMQGPPGAMTVTKLSYHFDNLIADRGDRDEVFGTLPGLIYKSTDRGVNWTDISGTWPNKIPTGLPINDVIEIVSGGAIYAATTMGVFKSENGGASWFSYQDGLPVVSVKRIFSIPGPKYDTLRIATYGRGFWQRLADDTDPNLIVSHSINGALLGLGGKNSVIHGVGLHGKIIKSTDGGSSWDTTVSGVSNNLSAVATIGDMTVIAAGDAGTGVRSSDAGQTWNQVLVETGGNITGISITPDATGWMCSDNGGILRSVDAGQSWLPQATLSGATLRSCQFVNDTVGFVLGQFSVGASFPIVYRTTNRGGNWNPTYPPTTSNLNKVFFTSETDGFVVGDGGLIMRTTDAGASWVTLTSGVGASLHDCLFTDHLTGYVCGDSGVIRMTEDAGTTWSGISNGTTANLRAITMSNTNLLAGGDGAIMVESKVHQNNIYYDLSNSWNLVSLPVSMPDSSVASIFPSRSSEAFSFTGSGYAASATMSRGSGYWVRFSADQVTHISGVPAESLAIPVIAGWNLIGSASFDIQTQDITGSPAGIVTSQFFGYNNGYVVAKTIERGKAYWVKVSQPGTLTLSLTPPAASKAEGRISIVHLDELPPAPPGGQNPLSQRLPAAFALDQNYPNPFNPATIIHYSLPADGKVRLVVYNMLGQVVQVLVDRIERAGYKSVAWNASGFATGIYFCRLEVRSVTDPAKTFTSVRKMALVR